MTNVDDAPIMIEGMTTIPVHFIRTIPTT